MITLKITLPLEEIFKQNSILYREPQGVHGLSPWAPSGPGLSP